MTDPLPLKAPLFLFTYDRNSFFASIIAASTMSTLISTFGVEFFGTIVSLLWPSLSSAADLPSSLPWRLFLAFRTWLSMYAFAVHIILKGIQGEYEKVLKEAPSPLVEQVRQQLLQEQREGPAPPPEPEGQTEEEQQGRTLVVQLRLASDRIPLADIYTIWTCQVASLLSVPTLIGSVVVLASLGGPSTSGVEPKRSTRLYAKVQFALQLLWTVGFAAALVVAKQHSLATGPVAGALRQLLFTRRLYIRLFSVSCVGTLCYTVLSYRLDPYYASSPHRFWLYVFFLVPNGLYVNFTFAALAHLNRVSEFAFDRVLLQRQARLPSPPAGRMSLAARSQALQDEVDITQKNQWRYYCRYAAALVLSLVGVALLFHLQPELWQQRAAVRDATLYVGLQVVTLAFNMWYRYLMREQVVSDRAETQKKA